MPAVESLLQAWRHSPVLSAYIDHCGSGRQQRKLDKARRLAAGTWPPPQAPTASPTPGTQQAAVASVDAVPAPAAVAQ